MPSLINAITAAVAFSGIVGATPIELRKPKHFTLKQVERSQVLRNGAQSKVRTFRKYGAKVPLSLLNAAFAGPNGSAPAVPGDQYDSLYLTPVTIGNTTVQLDPDTGSADL
jgi:hypothetical protein